jgi:hypothetical protein
MSEDFQQKSSDFRRKYEEEFDLEWDRTAVRLLDWTKSDAFRMVCSELNEQIDAVLQRRFKKPLSTIVKPLFLVCLLGQQYGEWIKETVAPMGDIYRKLLRMVVYSAALNHLVYERIQKEGPLMVRAMIARHSDFLRLSDRID